MSGHRAWEQLAKLSGAYGLIVGCEMVARWTDFYRVAG